MIKRIPTCEWTIIWQIARGIILRIVRGVILRIVRRTTSVNKGHVVYVVDVNRELSG